MQWTSLVPLKITDYLTELGDTEIGIPDGQKLLGKEEETSLQL